MTEIVIICIYNVTIQIETKENKMARYSRSSYSKSSSKSSSKSYSRSSYTKSYNNSTKQTCAQRKSPTKHNGSWYDAGGSKVRSTKAYFGTIDSNGKNWKDGC